MAPYAYTWKSFRARDLVFWTDIAKKWQFHVSTFSHFEVRSDVLFPVYVFQINFFLSVLFKSTSCSLATSSTINNQHHYGFFSHHRPRSTIWPRPNVIIHDHTASSQQWDGRCYWSSPTTSTKWNLIHCLYPCDNYSFAMLPWIDFSVWPRQQAIRNEKRETTTTTTTTTTLHTTLYQEAYQLPRQGRIHASFFKVLDQNTPNEVQNDGGSTLLLHASSTTSFSIQTQPPCTTCRKQLAISMTTGRQKASTEECSTGAAAATKKDDEDMIE